MRQQTRDGVSVDTMPFDKGAQFQISCAHTRVHKTAPVHNHKTGLAIRHITQQIHSGSLDALTSARKALRRAKCRVPDALPRLCSVFGNLG
jgi:hypothetical protein